MKFRAISKLHHPRN